MSFSGVWGGSAVAGLLDGMAESSSVKPRLGSEKWTKSKHGKGPQMHQVQRHSICVSLSVIRWSLAQSSPSPGRRKTKHTHTHTHSMTWGNLQWEKMCQVGVRYHSQYVANILLSIFLALPQFIHLTYTVISVTDYCQWSILSFFLVLFLFVRFFCPFLTAGSRNRWNKGIERGWHTTQRVF